MEQVQKIVFLFCIFLTSQVNAQLTVDAELRPRMEYRHGFKTLFPDSENPAAFVSQRTRLNAGFTTEKLNFYLSMQDVRVWGDVPQLNSSDKNGLGIHQAWGEIFFDEKFSLKLGRQEISYDDQRMMGSVGWAQQARSHDVALLRFSKEKVKFDLGFAFNQDSENITGTTLNIPGTYKSIQYAWLHRDWQHFQASFLLLSNGMQFIDVIDSENNETRYSQTIGSHLNYKIGAVGLISNLYYQFGKDVANNDLSAYLLALEANYKPSQTWMVTLGTELQSGNDSGAPSNGDNNAFTPLYGTNHKFNGFMDYFYVGNHNNTIGLLDFYFKAKAVLNQKSDLNIAVHNFVSPSEIAPNVSSQLGTELDLVYSYTLDKNIAFMGGYSHLFAAEGMETIKSNFDGNTNNWGWVMVAIKPTLFTNPDK